MKLSELQKIYFLGIGGIGMSALARYFNSRGIEIHGYDKTATTLTKKLVAEGMKIHYEEDLSMIPDGVDLVVWTPAVPKDHLELKFFREQGIPVKKRAEVLGMISRHNRTVAIAGTHGKTTTSSLVTHLLRTGGIDCTAFLGGIAQNYQSNYVEGKSDWVVAEADEYDRSFLHLSPDIAVILSMDPDHLDIYGDVDKMHESGFMAFVKRIGQGGKLFLKHSLAPFFRKQEKDDHLKEDGNIDFETFGVGEGAFRAEHIRVEGGWFEFDFIAPAGKYKANRISTGSGSQSAMRWEKVRTALPGRHNIENATVAMAIALDLGIGEEAIRKGLETFKGIKRRFEFIYRDEKRVFIDDYAHHPTEIRAAVQAARELYPGRKLTGIFQPHLYSRTRDFQEGFAEELDKLDEILLMDIYPARELPIPGITSEVIFDRMKNPNRILVTKSNVLEVLKDRQIEVLMTIGAGDIDTIVEPVKEHLERRN